MDKDAHKRLGRCPGCTASWDPNEINNKEGEVVGNDGKDVFFKLRMGWGVEKTCFPGDQEKGRPGSNKRLPGKLMKGVLDPSQSRGSAGSGETPCGISTGIQPYQHVAWQELRAHTLRPDTQQMGLCQTRRLLLT